jgi:V/A-type H+-transporting ATPase subunit C
MRELAKYSFVNAKIRAMLSYLISPGLFSRLLETKDITEAIGELKNTPYKNILKDINTSDIDLRELEKDLLRNDLAIYGKIYQALSTKTEKEFVRLLIQRYELEELKVILRIWHKKIPVVADEYLLQEKVAFEIDFKKILSSQNIEEVILFLDHTPYKNPLMKAKEKFKEKGSTFYLEVALDVDYYQRLINCVEDFSPLDKSIAQRILGIEIDIENINWLIRLRKYYSVGMGDMLEWFIPGGASIHKDTVRGFYATDGLSKVVESVALGPYAKIKELIEENVSLIESFLYEILLKQVKRALAGFPFTIGTVLGYLILKRKETRNIISLLYAKNYGWKREETAPLLNLC